MKPEGWCLGRAPARVGKDDPRTTKPSFRLTGETLELTSLAGTASGRDINRVAGGLQQRALIDALTMNRSQTPAFEQVAPERRNSRTPGTISRSTWAEVQARLSRNGSISQRHAQAHATLHALPGGTEVVDSKMRGRDPSSEQTTYHLIYPPCSVRTLADAMLRGVVGSGCFAKEAVFPVGVC